MPRRNGNWWDGGRSPKQTCFAGLIRTVSLSIAGPFSHQAHTLEDDASGFAATRLLAHKYFATIEVEGRLETCGIG
jgi:hypothetical protein